MVLLKRVVTCHFENFNKNKKSLKPLKSLGFSDFLKSGAADGNLTQKMLGIFRGPDRTRDLRLTKY